VGCVGPALTRSPVLAQADKAEAAAINVRTRRMGPSEMRLGFLSRAIRPRSLEQR
jgi:hypothetical protein